MAGTVILELVGLEDGVVIYAMVYHIPAKPDGGSYDPTDSTEEMNIFDLMTTDFEVDSCAFCVLMGIAIDKLVLADASSDPSTFLT